MDRQAPLIAITGGIGAGKSVVSRMLRVLGYEVFDCDTEARKIMDTDEAIIKAIGKQICAEAVYGGKINRELLGAVVFSDAAKRSLLNEIVHGAVLAWLQKWHSRHNAPAFVETALLYTSGLDRTVDAEWRVCAPVDVRIERVMRRNGLAPEHIRARIASQAMDENPPRPHHDLTYITNDGSTAIMPQLFQALDTMASMRSPRASVKP